MPADEPELWSRWIGSRDQAARDALVELHLGIVDGVLWQLAHCFVAGGPEQGDARSEGMIALIRAVETYDSERAAFRTWANRVVYNGVLTWLRGSPRLETSEEPPEVPDPRAPSPEEELLEKEEREAIRRKVDRLPPDLRELVVKFYWHGQSLKEIAEQKGHNHAYIRGRMVKTRKKLKEMPD